MSGRLRAVHASSDYRWDSLRKSICVYVRANKEESRWRRSLKNHSEIIINSYRVQNCRGAAQLFVVQAWMSLVPVKEQDSLK